MRTIKEFKRSRSNKSLNRTRYQWIVAFVFLCGCADPPLLSTPLPNGYEFKSNGGIFGYIVTPAGKRMTNYFGIINAETEAWCEEFAWQDEMVLCKRNEYGVSSFKPKTTNYLLLNTINSEVSIVGFEKAKLIWQQQLGSQIPKMVTIHNETQAR